MAPHLAPGNANLRIGAQVVKTQTPDELGSSWLVRVIGALCALVFVFVLRGQVHGLRDVVASILMLAPYIVVIVAWRHRPSLIVGFSLITGIIGALLVRLVVGLSHYGVPSPASTAQNRYLSDMAWANLTLFFSALATWVSKNSKMNSIEVGKGAAIATVFWIGLVAILMGVF